MIPLSRPDLGLHEERILLQALRDCHLGGNGEETRRTLEYIRKSFGLDHVLLTTSGTHALELALWVLDLPPGSEVICPSFTYVSSANAIVHRGLRPVLAEIDPRTMNLDPEDAARRITERTRAIVVVHYAGVACDMERFEELATERGLAIVEDAAHALDACHRGRPLGAIGDVGCWSFHATKNMTCGEGGAWITRRPELLRRAEIILEKGTDRAAFLRREVESYQWHAAGSSYVLSDLLAALLRAQLERRGEITTRRCEFFDRYLSALGEFSRTNGFQLPHVPSDCQSNGHLFWMLAPDRETRERLIEHLGRQDIQAAGHFFPLHSSAFGQGELGHRPEDLPITQSAAWRLVRLPLFSTLSQREHETILEALQRFR